MKFCSKCGKEIVDEAVICPHCGCAVEGVRVITNLKKEESGSKIAAKIFMIIGCICTGLVLLPLAWTIPMTVSYYNKVNRGESVSTGFKVCCLLFVSMIAGILMLCDKD